MGGPPKPPQIRPPQIRPPEITPLPKPEPLPPPVPTEVTPLRTAEARRKRVAAVRYGILSTIKTSPLGIVGAGVDLTAGRGKTVLGA